MWCMLLIVVLTGYAHFIALHQLICSFQPISEYKTQYNPHSSHKSQSFNPSPDQAAPMAGIGSEKLGTVQS